MEMINIDSIKIDNEYLRLNTNVDKLVKSIETVGIIHPLIINDKNELISGGRRYTALKQLGRTEVPCIKVSHNILEQELISIDENLVRQDLNKLEMEKCLSRGKEIFEQLYPKAIKFNDEDLTKPENNEIKKDLPTDERSFIDITAEKTGLSKKVIKSAIERDEKTSAQIKKLRSDGSLNASQTNELIKLDREEQELIAPMIIGKSAKVIKKLVKDIGQNGFEKAVQDYQTTPNFPKEFQSLATLIARTNKVLGKIILEEMKSDHEEVEKILEQMSTLRIHFDQFLEIHTSANESSFYNHSPSNDDLNEVSAH